jgi:homogentisate 1,2-dioxygenase
MSKIPFTFPLTRGIHSKQAHVNVPEGTVEEEVGREGFFGPATHLYHQKAPTDWYLVEGECRPQAYDLNKIPVSTDWQQSRLFYNSSVQISMVHSKVDDPWYSRNADGDEMHFIHEGSGTFESDFGTLSFKKGDYVYAPRSTNYRFLSNAPVVRLVIESRNGYFTQPDRGILGHHALYDPAMLVLPEIGPSTQGPTDKARSLWQVRMKRANRFSNVYYKRNPLDVVGLKGDLTSFKLSIHDIRPIMSHRAHLAPSVHSTFVAQGFVICSFVPRPLEEEPGAQRVPFFHRNVEYDEILFYHDGDFFSRDNIRPGWLSFHPTGIHHGPHPKAFANQFKKDRTNEYAVMIDTREPLEIDQSVLPTTEWKDYWKSWSTDAG